MTDKSLNNRENNEDNSVITAIVIINEKDMNEIEERMIGGKLHSQTHLHILSLSLKLHHLLSIISLYLISILQFVLLLLK